MSVLFIAPTLTPGRSGVGDYTSLLAEKIESEGIPCHLVGFNDSTSTDAQDKARRFPTPWARSKRLWMAARASANKKEIDAVSLQFVTYGYHPKGLPFGLARQLRRICGTARIQIMFHELWCGGPGSRWRDHVYGILQHWIIRDLVRVLRPAVIHTHATPYLESLQREGWSPKKLPLFSSIPILKEVNKASLTTWLEKTSGIEDAGERIVFCLFGSLYPQWQPETLLALLRAYLEEIGRKGLVLAIGRMGAPGEKIWRQVESTSDERLRFAAVGALSDFDVGQCFALVDYGISTTPPDLIEKSAAAAAMFAHGLPLLASRPPVSDVAVLKRVEAQQPLLIAGANLARFYEFRKGIPDRVGVNRVARQFLTDMDGAANGTNSMRKSDGAQA